MFIAYLLCVTTMTISFQSGLPCDWENDHISSSVRLRLKSWLWITKWRATLFSRRPGKITQNNATAYILKVSKFSDQKMCQHLRTLSFALSPLKYIHSMISHPNSIESNHVDTIDCFWGQGLEDGTCSKTQWAVNNSK